MVTQTENQLGFYSTRPADLGAILMTTQSTYYMCGYSNGPGSQTISHTGGYPAGTSTMTLSAITSFFVGEQVLIDGATAKAELLTISAISSPTLTFSTPTLYAHATATTVIGTYAAFTPSFSGRLLVKCIGTVTANTSGDVDTLSIVYIDPTGAAAPVVSAAATGTAIGNVASATQLTGVLTQPFICEALLGGTAAPGSTLDGGAAMTVGAPYIFDLKVQNTAAAGKTATVKNVVWMIREV